MNLKVAAIHNVAFIAIIVGVTAYRLLSGG